MNHADENVQPAGEMAEGSAYVTVRDDAIRRVAKALHYCAEDLEAELRRRSCDPRSLTPRSDRRRFHRDMAPVREAMAALRALGLPKQDPLSDSPESVDDY